ncbi:mothers against decapentaplegic homolog 6 [Drosophila erecta]|uniref:mothers against decapentaplegic homolog 6 n=1 Tax=Drosophila erecta TaxID=7220 RepID=UPI000F068453|nr:mothers against decapentaplegic homolog 6 [Drosophila erecta]XP_026839473.1 mothers against decapentaplegic homolog 6 [Drosophila erecta]XP_026839474.1 mothers against decapentaplegic homolog 6 [Drosophila erecta]
MIFPNEKKALWRLASSNNQSNGVPAAPPAQPPRPPPPPHRPRPHHRPPCFGYYEEHSLAMRQTPPPPYSSMPCAMDCSSSNSSSCGQSLSLSQGQNHNNNNNNSHSYRRLPNHMDLLSPPPSACDPYCTAPGCSCASSCDDMLIDGSDLDQDQNQDRKMDQGPVQPVDRRMISATTFATMFRKCCGGATESISGSTLTIPVSTVKATAHPPLTQVQNGKRMREDFAALMKQLKRKQRIALLDAVQSRVSPPTRTKRDVVEQTTTTTAPTYLQCILIPSEPCKTQTDWEPHVAASRLFFWKELTNGKELKRLPVCPAARDCIYMCCNPLHWFRILHQPETEAPTPPCQRSKMLRLRDADFEEDSQNDAKSAALSTWSAQSTSISSFYKPTLYESVTTDGKDHNINSKVWCQIAYWEMAHRVGEFFHAKTNAVNIYTDGIVASEVDSMCLRDLTPAGNQIHSEAVPTARQTVGLGVTLSLENGDVWIYNRGNTTIFVDSPTLAENLDRVCKVMPGYCLKAFETNRAELLSMKGPGHHPMGPVDYFSIKISFGKGWGRDYKRQDIMGCPCWLEVHFSHLR